MNRKNNEQILKEFIFYINWKTSTQCTQTRRVSANKKKQLLIHRFLPFALLDATTKLYNLIEYRENPEKKKY